MSDPKDINRKFDDLNAIIVKEVAAQSRFNFWVGYLLGVLTYVIVKGCALVLEAWL